MLVSSDFVPPSHKIEPLERKGNIACAGLMCSILLCTPPLTVTRGPSLWTKPIYSSVKKPLFARYGGGGFCHRLQRKSKSMKLVNTRRTAEKRLNQPRKL